MAGATDSAIEDDKYRLIIMNKLYIIIFLKSITYTLRVSDDSPDYWYEESHANIMQIIKEIEGGILRAVNNRY